MIATIFLSSDPENNLHLAQVYARERGIHPADITIEEASGIAEMKQLQHDAMLMPSAGKHKAIIIAHAEEMSIPAQNALLKLLEEPPEYLYFFLLTTSLDALLPTIQSRCQIVKREEVKQVLTAEQKEEIESFLTTIQTGTIGDKLYLAQQLTKEKEEVLSFLIRCELVLHEKLLANPTEEIVTLLDQLLQLKQTITMTNVNPRMAVEDMLLS